MITDQQVILMRLRRMEGKRQQTAASVAGMSVRSARKWQHGPLPSETKRERWWRTRPDPFARIWEEEIAPLLEGDAAGRLKATTIIEWLEERHPGRFSASQLRTLQRRLQDWRVLHGPEREVYFPQEHPPGREAQIDFTRCNALGVSLGGRPYRHLLFQFVLSHSGWRYAEVASGETFLALKQGVQAALWSLGGAPQVIRSDNTSALTHELRHSRGRALNDAYAELLDHYGLRSSLTNPGSGHENGVAEHAHYRLKDALDQALMLRGSRDFDSKEDYSGFVSKVVERRNRLVQGKLEQERDYLQPLPPAPVPEYVNYRARVRKWSTIQAAGRTYSVPSRPLSAHRKSSDPCQCAPRVVPAVCHKGDRSRPVRLESARLRRCQRASIPCPIPAAAVYPRLPNRKPRPVGPLSVPRCNCSPNRFPQPATLSRSALTPDRSEGTALAGNTFSRSRHLAASHCV